MEEISKNTQNNYKAILLCFASGLLFLLIYFLHLKLKFGSALNYDKFIEDLGIIHGLALFVGLPAMQGFILGYVGKKQDLFNLTLFIYLVDVAFAYLFMGEQIICLLMASPIIIICVYWSGLFGRYTVNQDKVLRVSLVPIAIAFFAFDITKPDYQFQTAVSDQVVISASPAVVWKYVMSQPDESAKPDYWLWRIGLPIPLRSENSTNEIGGIRKCYFSQNVYYLSKLTEVIPEKRLTFDVVEQARHPEIYGHVNFDRGQFELIDNHNGTTTLINTGWYQVYIKPVSYFNLWSEDVAHHIHRHILEHIKALSETDQKI